MKIDKKGNPQTKITEIDFLEKAKEIVYNKYLKEGFDGIAKKQIQKENYRKTLMNHKATFKVKGIGTLMETTYNGNTNQIYLGMYKCIDRLKEATLIEPTEEEFLEKTNELVLELLNEEGLEITKENLKLESYRNILENHEAIVVAPGTKILTKSICFGDYYGTKNKIVVGMFKKVSTETIDL